MNSPGMISVSARSAWDKGLILMVYDTKSHFADTIVLEKG
jgi:hypothetical protein